MSVVRAIQATRLDGIGLLDPLNAAEREDVSRQCSFLTLSKGDTVFSRGEADGKGVALVVSGMLSVRSYASNGKEVVYDYVGPGGHTGELSAIDGGPRSANVEAACCNTVIALMPAAVFRRVVSTNPEISLAVHTRLAAMVRHSSSRIMDLATTPGTTRVYKEILRLALVTSGGGPRPDRLAISDMPDQYELASRTGLTRETVCRALSKLQKLDVIERERGCDSLVVKDMRALEELAESEDA